MQTINALHIASFNGNIGDNANHNGFRHRLKEVMEADITFDNLEMREFYQSWGLREFNSPDFIELSNKYDLIIFGGGNFFELKWDYSHTGTTIDLSQETLEAINTPMLFHGVGCDIAKGASEEAIAKFERFLTYISSSNKYYISVRNDGSMETIQKLYGDKFDDVVTPVPDGAFFIEGLVDSSQKTNKRSKVGINVVNDMKDLRFDVSKDNQISYEQFIEELAQLINEYIEEHDDYDIVFFPHIYSDLKSIYQVISLLSDSIRRTRVEVAPLLTGQGTEKILFGLYNSCDFVMGMRFHTNVCAITQNIPTIALSSYKKIDDTYRELSLENRVVKVNEINFAEVLKKKMNSTISNLEEIRQLYDQTNQKVEEQSQTFYQGVNSWFNSL